MKYKPYIFFISLFVIISLNSTQTMTVLAVSSHAIIRFAVIGDYGNNSTAEAEVANLVKSWDPDFIITLGDNNYPSGGASTIDQNIGKYYQEFIYPYTGSYGSGAITNRFFPSLGNHDWDNKVNVNNVYNIQPYLDYFSLPGNERYYTFTKGPVQFFAIDSDPREPDGISSTSTQAEWLQEELSVSETPWQIVYMHHPPYSSSSIHGSTATMQWDYNEWGADTVMAGHVHSYERLLFNELPYFVNGSGGASLYAFGTPLPESQFRYHTNYGAMLVTATDTQVNFKFYNRNYVLIDEYTVSVIFADVHQDYWARSWIERLYASKITDGCSTDPLIYCPHNLVTRAEMAVFLLRGIHGADYDPPVVGNSTGFNDVPTNYWAAEWIKQLGIESITSGCGGGNYCPNASVTRAQMAVFLLRSKYGASYTPPAATGTMFADVSSNSFAAAWIEQLAVEGITGGCGGGNYCPNTSVTRSQMAVFLVKAFELP